MIAMIAMENVVKRYLMGDVVVSALNGINLAVAPGEFAVVLGASGSGKSTLLNLMGGLDTPTEGRVAVNGFDVASLSRAESFAFRRKSISFIFQGFNLFPALTALENVQFAVDLQRGRSTADAKQVLESVGLGERVHHFSHELSGGEQQRVAIARALATGNPVMLADEPTGDLDFRTGVQILQLLKGQTEAGKTVMLVTHNREISRAADRVIELSSGRVVSDGPPRGGRAAISDLHW